MKFTNEKAENRYQVGVCYMTQAECCPQTFIDRTKKKQQMKQKAEMKLVREQQGRILQSSKPLLFKFMMNKYLMVL